MTLHASQHTHFQPKLSLKFIYWNLITHLLLVLFPQELENRLAQFHGREDAILYGSCFDANAGLFESMLTPEDGVFSDALNHASIIDGIRLCKAQKHRYPHRDLSGKFNFVHMTF